MNISALDWPFILVAMVSYVSFFFISSYFLTIRYSSPFDFIFLKSYTVHEIYQFAIKSEDYKETIKSFYEMKYENLSGIIKGLGALVIALISTVAESFIKGTKLSDSDKSVLYVAAELLIIVIVLSITLRQTILEYKKAIIIYSIFK